MGFIIRVAVSIGLLLTLVIPPLAGFSDAIGPSVLSAFSAFTIDFVDSFSDFFINVRGLINYVISSYVGSPAITAFNVIINIGFLFPTFAYAVRFALGIKSFII